MFIEIPVFSTNSVDPDHMPHSVASDLGLHILPVTLFGASRLNCLTIAYFRVSLLTLWRCCSKTSISAAVT